ncbi:hypothetical protein EJB05_36348 [Eragrostis curvula]|uniref:Uncharacterized protein n=1 Tax=Eragrostis curvula TaxID=38414 RepID=A0A5J9U8U4_9POAL|nr:hypothetical protein EJB05_36348 [Eragrostis curvula]
MATGVHLSLAIVPLLQSNEGLDDRENFQFVISMSYSYKSLVKLWFSFYHCKMPGGFAIGRPGLRSLARGKGQFSQFVTTNLFIQDVVFEIPLLMTSCYDTIWHG